MRAPSYGPPGEDGERVRLATARVALPGQEFAQVAEGEGCAEAVRLLLATGFPPVSTRVVRDNLAVIRHAAGLTRLHRPTIHQALAAPWRTWCGRGGPRSGWLSAGA